MTRLSAGSSTAPGVYDDTVALILLDIDEFKSINDRFGHDVGDEVLREIAIRLRAACRAGDTVARIGEELR